MKVNQLLQWFWKNWVGSSISSFCIFFVDILHSSPMLSKVFQLKFTNVIIMGNIMCTEIAQFYMRVIFNSCDLNVDVFNESNGYYILANYGPHGRYLKGLQSEWGNLYFTTSEWHGLGLALTWKRYWWSKKNLHKLFVPPLMDTIVTMTWFLVLRFWAQLTCLEDKRGYKIGVSLNWRLCWVIIG